MRFDFWKEKKFWEKVWANLPEIFLGVTLVLGFLNVGMWVETEASFRTGLFDPFATSRVMAFDVSFLMTLLVLGIQKRKVEWNWRKKEWLSLGLILGILVVGSAIWGENPERSFWVMVRLVEIGGVMVVMKSLMRREMVMKILAGMGAVQGSLAGLQFLNQGSLGLGKLGESPFDSSMPGVGKGVLFGEKVVRSMGTFPHANVLGGVLAVIFVLVLLKKKRGKWDWVILGFLGIGILASWSRGAILGVILGGGWVLWNKKEELGRWMKMGILGVGGLAGLMFLARMWMGGGVGERWEGMKVAWEVLKGNPLLGVGLGNFTQGMEVSGLEIWEVQPVHNVAVLWGVEMGLLAGILLVGILGWWVMRRLRWARMRVGAVFLVMLPGFLFDHFWWDVPQGLFLGVVFLVIVSEMKRERKVKEVMRRWVKRGKKKFPVRKYSKWG